MKLPDCMMPDGGESCIGYQEALDRIAAIEADLQSCRDDYAEHVAMVARKERPAYDEQQRRINALESELAAAKEQCTWSEDIDGNYETGCGNLFTFTSDGPNENGFCHCPYCGKSIS